LSASGSRRAIPDASSREGPLEGVGDSGQKTALQADDSAGNPAPKFSLGLVLLAILGALGVFVMGWAAIRAF
ncbi:MAG TPA: hypothetical protein VMS40_21605, partial [Vicinamibacterales bacterium]|nr:hypothetical protein [Vicinamibacterales bacterium]